MSAPRKDRDPKATEREMLDLLERSLAKHGNGGSGEYAFMRQVRNSSGFNANRTFDGVAVGLWPSRGHDIHVYEVKVSRSDWLHELRQPKKADDAARVADRFSIVAPRDVVDLAEVPATWGLIHATGGTEITEEAEPLFPGELPRTISRVEGRKLRTVRAAPLLRPAEDCRGPIPREFMVPLLRAAGAVPDPTPPHQRLIDEAVAKAVAAERRHHEEKGDKRLAQAEARDVMWSAFTRASGVFVTKSTAEERGHAVRLAMAANEGPAFARNYMRRALQELERTCENLRFQLERVDVADAEDGAA